MISIHGTEYPLEVLYDKLPAEGKKRIFKKIIEARTKYSPIAEMSDEDQTIAISAIINQSHLVFGFDFVADGEYKSSMIKLIRKFLLQSGYGKYTEPEFLLAMFYNGWSKNEQPKSIDFDKPLIRRPTFNTHFLSEVLSNYEETRALLEKYLFNVAQQTNHEQ